MTNKMYQAIGIILMFCVPIVDADEKKESDFSFFDDLKDITEIHGFYDMRGGFRTQNDPYEKDMSIMENRLQLGIFSYPEWGDITVRGDGIGDFVEEKAKFDLREANIFLRPTDYMDIRVGRQILTWGTGDLIFINDLFPKDYRAFFIGRDIEYLKAPSDAAKISLFSDMMNVDFVYTPQFDPDRFITGKRLSYWNASLGRIAGRDAIVHTDKPNRWFSDSEYAVRLYRKIKNYELAMYGYHGYWKSPAGQNTSMTQAIFPDLDVYGASIRGVVSKGIGNAEIGFYDSTDDCSGKNPLINNSEMRYLLGYTQEIGKNLTLGLQYYVEQLLEYDQYRDNLPGGHARDQFRHLTALRLTKLLMNQNLECSFFGFYSPSDQDVYLRPNINYKLNDNTALEVGGNVFFGEHKYTFFSQFQYDTNIYAGYTYSF